MNTVFEKAQLKNTGYCQLSWTSTVQLSKESQLTNQRQHAFVNARTDLPALTLGNFQASRWVDAEQNPGKSQIQ
jgi:hypothetical protein